MISDLKACSNETCLIEVANKLAENLAKKAPTLARELELTEKKIEEKKVIIETAKEIEVNIESG